MSQMTGKAVGNSIRVLKEANKYLVLQCIMTLAPLSTEDIIKNTGLSRPTVLNIIKELEEADIVMKDGFSESNGGRSAALLTLNRSKHYAVGVDFEFPTVRMVIANLKGETRCSKRLVYNKSIRKEELLQDFYRNLHSFIDDSGIDPAMLDGIGVGISGVIDSARGVSLTIERIFNWSDVPIKGELEREFGIPVYIRNDVHLLGLVEKKMYLPEDMTDFIYVAIRSGIGSITYQHNRPMRGEKGNAGFIGHTTVNPEGALCHCGSRGCLETYAGQLAIEAYYRELSGKQVSFDEVMRLACEEDPTAIRVLKQAGFFFGVALANLVKTYEIPNVIIGCIPEHDSRVFVEATESALHDHIPDSLHLEAKLCTGHLSEAQYALGGCYLVFEHMFSKPKLALSLV